MEYNEQESRTFQEWKLNHELAVATHASHRSDLAQIFESALNFGLEAIRTAVLVNGGAVIAMFAFLGATFNAPSEEMAPIRTALLTPAFLFGVGAVAAGAASGFAYFAQTLFCRALETHHLHWDRPFIRPVETTPGVYRHGTVWQVFSVLSVIGSYLCLVVGLAMAYCALA